MIMLNAPIGDFRPPPASVVSASYGTAFSAWFIESPHRQSEADPEPGTGESSKPVTMGLSNQDLLIADIAKLARNYLGAGAAPLFALAASADRAGIPSQGQADAD